MIQSLLVSVLMYVFFFVIVYSALTMITRLIKRKFRERMRIKIDSRKLQEKTLTKKIMRAIMFTIKEDKRNTKGIKNRTIFFSIYLIGLLLSIGMAFMNKVGFVLVFSLIFYLAIIIFSYYSTKNLFIERDKVLDKIYTIKQRRMGLVEKPLRNEAINYDSEFKVTEWDKDYVHPKRIIMSIPVDFDQLACNSFLEQFSLYFGTQGAHWVPDRANKEHPGWDFVGGYAALMKTDPLPLRADWSEKYLLNDRVSWSFFPIALGSENGITLVDPKTKKETHLLGFDLAGTERKLAKKKGFQIGDELVAAPMVLIAGGTGGGKALECDTPVEVVDKKSENLV